MKNGSLFAGAAVCVLLAVSCLMDGEYDEMETASETPFLQSSLSGSKMRVALFWKPVSGAEGYVVQYGPTPRYGCSVTTKETTVEITDLDNRIWYFMVQTEKGDPVDTFPAPFTMGPLPIPAEGGVNSGAVDGKYEAEQTTEQPTEDKPADKAAFDWDAFARERAAWEAQNIQSYQFTASVWDGFGTSGTEQIKVAFGKEPEVTYGGTQPLHYELGHTIDEVYESIAAIILENGEKTEYDNGRYSAYIVTYNGEYHYPESFYNGLFSSSGEPLIGLPAKYEIIGFSVPEAEQPTEDKPADKAAFDWDAFARERAAWEAQNIQSYQFTASVWDGFGTSGTEQIKVAFSKEPEVTYGGTQPLYYELGHTIDEVYESIAAIILENGEKTEYDNGRYSAYIVTYNGEYHYPESFYNGLFSSSGEPLIGLPASYKITSFSVLD